MSWREVSWTFMTTVHVKNWLSFLIISPYMLQDPTTAWYRLLWSWLHDIYNHKSYIHFRLKSSCFLLACTEFLWLHVVVGCHVSCMSSYWFAMLYSYSCYCYVILSLGRGRKGSGGLSMHNLCRRSRIYNSLNSSSKKVVSNFGIAQACCSLCRSWWLLFLPVFGPAWCMWIHSLSWSDQRLQWIRQPFYNDYTGMTFMKR